MWQLPKYVLSVAEKLEEAGYEAHLVGGSLRDLLLDRIPKDYDIATNAYPEQIEALFPKSIPTGAKFGTIVVLVPDEHGETQQIEVTTYRNESDYVGGRWPSKVEFTREIKADLERRDFTINAMALRLEDAKLEQSDLIDPFGGQEDLKAGVIRAVGDPVERFTEDGLRPIRACRLAANLGFEIEPETFAAISKTLTIIDNISAERVRDELNKLVLNSPKPSLGFELLRESGILEIIIPELLEGIEVNQLEYHVDDVYTHSLKALDIAEDSVKWAALFHDIAKPRTYSQDDDGSVHFYGHDQQGAEMTREIMARLKFSKAEIKRTANLVRWHMFYYPNADWRKQLEPKRPQKGKLQLIVIRHGATEDTEKKIVSGHSPTNLSEAGKKEVRSLAQELKDTKSNAVITSPIKRALESAQIISHELGLEVIRNSKFSERNFGELTGLSWEQFSEKYPQLAKHPKNTPNRQNYLPSGESIAQVESRVRIGLFNLTRDFAGQKVCLVTHSGVIRVIKRLLEIDSDSRDDLGTAEYFKVELDPAQLDPTFLSDAELAQAQKEHEDPSNNVPGGWTDGAVRRFIKRIGGPDEIDDLLKLRIADATANSKSVFNPEEIRVLAERIAAVREQDMALNVGDLDVNGKDLMQELEMTPGKELGEILNQLLEKVIDDPLLNDREKLLQLAREMR